MMQIKSVMVSQGRGERETDRVRVGEGEAEQMERLTDCFWYRVTDWDTNKSCSCQIYHMSSLAVYLLAKSHNMAKNNQAH